MSTMADAMAEIQENYQQSLDEGEIIPELEEYVDRKFGFNHDAVVAHNEYLAQERERIASESRIKAAYDPITAIEGARDAEAVATAKKLNETNGINSLHAMRAEYIEILLKMFSNTE